jgi:hypothetical protein
VVWALAELAVNNKASAKTMLLERQARVLLWLGIFASPLSGQVQEELQDYQTDRRPLCVPKGPIVLTIRKAVSEWVCGKPLFQSKEKISEFEARSEYD